MNNIPFTLSGGLLTCTFIGTVLWEHCGRKYMLRYRPSVGLEFISNRSQFFFWVIGRKITWLSSYLTIINSKDIGVTIDAILRPLCGIVFSPFYIIYGYLNAAKSYQNKRWMIYAGSILTVTTILYGANYISQPKSLWSFLRLTN